MANIKSAQKRNRQAQRQRAENAAVRTTVRSVVKVAREAIASKDAKKAIDAVRQATRTVARAASKGVLHPRNASRRIARLAKSLSAAIHSS